ncbi:hydrogenase/urease accessory protein HupE [Kribbella amoyensis]|uniref:Hydrogenase/urease accessory protein HupE n=1 Tax=Kribbella amoyensis TaxID=996641 RepID=A0A561BWA4_9ACTN|nr:HupE/UreJ family protein [Kribbella amoyensis]TWD83159.1 hydrogenase/urease accessory protein HupE [Kribbella amoyensis]
MRRRLLAVAGLVLFLLAGGAATASAHVIASTGYATVHQDGHRVTYQLSLEYAVLARAVDLGAPATDDGRRAQALDAGKPAIAEYLHDRVVVALDGAACEPELETTSVGQRAQKAYAELGLVYTCAGDGGSYHLKYTVFGDEEAVADDHTNLVEYSFGGETGRTVFDRGHHDFTVGDNTLAGSSLQFGKMGVEHILLGLDHVLFVVALMLGATSFRSLVQVVSMFTVAHSVTLVSTLLGGFTVPAVVVEPLIALSIAFVAVENLLGSTRHRLPVVFGFGLLHGLGFAGSLRITDRVSPELLVSLLSFNVGIEVGQALLLVAVFPLVLLIRRTRFSVPAVRSATGVVAAFGLCWFVERFFLA